MSSLFLRTVSTGRKGSLSWVSSIHASSSATGFTNSLRVTPEFRTKLIAVIFPLPNGYETLSHPESAWAASRSKHFSPSLSSVALISMTLSLYFFIVTCADVFLIQQKNINSTKMSVSSANTCMWVYLAGSAQEGN